MCSASSPAQPTPRDASSSCELTGGLAMARSSDLSRGAHATKSAELHPGCSSGRVG